jgi:phage terminase large subunit GpA-like protein
VGAGEVPQGRARPQRIIDEELAWYECSSCAERITDAQKIAALQRGVWVPEGGEGHEEGQGLRGTPRTRHRGYHIWAAYSPWIDWATLVAKFLELKDEDLQNWVNSWLGEPWVEKDREATEELVLSRRVDYEAGWVPQEAVVLTAGIDVQDGRKFYVTVRAWGYRFRSWLVEAMELRGYDALTELVTETAWPKVGTGRGDGYPTRLHRLGLRLSRS